MNKLDKNVLKKIAKDALFDFLKQMGFSDDVSERIIGQILEHPQEQDEAIKKFIDDLIAYRLLESLSIGEKKVKVLKKNEKIEWLLKRRYQITNVEIPKLEKLLQCGKLSEEEYKKIKNLLMKELKNIEASLE